MPARARGAHAHAALSLKLAAAIDTPLRQQAAERRQAGFASWTRRPACASKALLFCASLQRVPFRAACDDGHAPGGGPHAVAARGGGRRAASHRRARAARRRRTRFADVRSRRSLLRGRAPAAPPGRRRQVRCGALRARVQRDCVVETALAHATPQTNVCSAARRCARRAAAFPSPPPPRCRRATPWVVRAQHPHNTRIRHHTR
jgi:hypothetical protein